MEEKTSEFLRLFTETVELFEFLQPKKVQRSSALKKSLIFKHPIFSKRA